jgi:hypothetical protein
MTAQQRSLNVRNERDKFEALLRDVVRVWEGIPFTSDNGAVVDYIEEDLFTLVQEIRKALNR